MQRTATRSPTAALFLGLIITLAAVITYSWYITHQISGLRALQNNLVDRNRKDSLQLLRVQNDLNSLALAMRDMLDNDEPYPLTAWSAQFARTHADLDDALQIEERISGAHATPEQRQILAASFRQFWDAVDRTFALERDGHDKDARDQIRFSLQARIASLNNAVSRLLVQNNESEDQAAQQVSRIYHRVQLQVYLFLSATLAAILLTSLYSIVWNRRLFAQLASLSQQRSELAQKLISTQESVLRYISRELHDEFGQILTAVGSMLGRVGRHVPPDSPVHSELHEIQGIAQTTLEHVRSLSQSLHPVMLEEIGLESTIDWYIATAEKQLDIRIQYEKSGRRFPVDPSAGIHIYRVLQEALNNVARHSGVRDAQVALHYHPEALELRIEDHGKGLVVTPGQPGIGLVAMRERTELLDGRIEMEKPEGGGTRIRLQVPRKALGEKQETNA